MPNLPPEDQLLKLLLETELVFLDRTYDLVPLGTDFTYGYMLRIVHADGTLISSEEYDTKAYALEAFSAAVQEATLQYILESAKSA